MGTEVPQPWGQWQGPFALSPPGDIRPHSSVTQTHRRSLPEGPAPVQGQPPPWGGGAEWAPQEESGAWSLQRLGSEQSHNLLALSHKYQVNGVPGISSRAKPKNQTGQPSFLYATARQRWVPLDQVPLQTKGPLRSGKGRGDPRSSQTIFQDVRADSLRQKENCAHTMHGTHGLYFNR